MLCILYAFYMHSMYRLYIECICICIGIPLMEEIRLKIFVSSNLTGSLLVQMSDGEILILPQKLVCNFGDCRENLFEMYGDCRENLFEILAVVRTSSPIPSVRGYNACIGACACITGWRRPIGCLILIRHFPQKSPVISGSFATNDLQLKASYRSLPPSSMCRLFIECTYTNTCIQIYTYKYE